jgi:hypothetical protein
MQAVLCEVSLDFRFWHSVRVIKSGVVHLGVCQGKFVEFSELQYSELA